MHIVKQLDDSTHLCLRCGKTLTGLENYVTHRQLHCPNTLTPPDSKEKDISTEDVTQSCVVAPLSSSPPQSSSWDAQLTASDFFSCLELQSTVSAPRTDVSSGIPSQQLVCSPKPLRDADLELPTTSAGVTCHPFDDVEDFDQGFFSECETNSTEYYPPRTYTGGKWKPGSRPHLRNRQQWGVENSQSTACDMEHSAKKCTVQNEQTCPNDCVVDSLNFESHQARKSAHSKNACSNGSMKKDALNFESHPTRKGLHSKNARSDGSMEKRSRASQKRKLSDSSNLFVTDTKPSESFACAYCNDIWPEQFGYTLHLLSVQHKAHFLDAEDYNAEIFKHESMLIHTMLFQCYVCSFYFNDLKSFLSHMESTEHTENFGSQKKLLCLPWGFCKTSKQMKRKLRKKNFKNVARISHPIIILRNQKSPFCSFCVGTCHYKNIFKKRKSRILEKVCYMSTMELASFHLRNFLNECPFCGRSFMKKDFEAHLKICSNIFLCNGVQVPENITKEECSTISFSPPGSSSPTIPKASSVSSTVCNNVNAVTADSNLGSDACKEKACVLVVRSTDRGSIKFAHKKTLLKNMKLKYRHNVLKYSKCDFRTVDKQTHHLHEESHNKKCLRPPFVCEICGSAQSRRWRLKQHMRLHSERTFKCDSDGCQRVCRTQNELVRHQRMHTNERPYSCDLCAYSGKTAHQLKKHQRTHTGERPFKCKHCSYSASLSHQLLRHMRLHTGSKPYKCPYCDYVCNNQENIRKHILKTKKHEGKKMYPCKFCAFGCDAFPEFQKHLLCAHKEHFPKGLEDVESSVVAGLYKKDFPRTESTKDNFTEPEEA